MATEISFQFQLTGPDGEQSLVAAEGVTIIGRQEGSDLHLPAPQVSRQHARLDCTATTCQITDLDSANGTYLNGEKLAPGEPHALQAGDVIQIGPYELVCETIAAEEEPSPADEEYAEELEFAPTIVLDAVDAEDLGERAPAPTPQPDFTLPPGLSLEHSRYLQYLPGIYHTPFMNRFLALFESILAPIEWTVDNFDLFLSPSTAPELFLPWLARLYRLTFDHTWEEEQRRTLLAEAADLFARRGTRSALERILEIYLGVPVDVDDQDEELDPFTFTVTLPVGREEVDEILVEQLIDAHKPAHTQYRLSFL